MSSLQTQNGHEPLMFNRRNEKKGYEKGWDLRRGEHKNKIPRVCVCVCMYDQLNGGRQCQISTFDNKTIYSLFCVLSLWCREKHKKRTNTNLPCLWCYTFVCTAHILHKHTFSHSHSVHIKSLKKYHYRFETIWCVFRFSFSGSVCVVDVRVYINNRLSQCNW